MDQFALFKMLLLWFCWGGEALKWVQKYRESGIDGLKNNSGKNSIGRPKGKLSQLEKLQKEILELRIENERLKKGYFVKGDGARKEYVTSLEKNTK